LINTEKIYSVGSWEISQTFKWIDIANDGRKNGGPLKYGRGLYTYGYTVYSLSPEA